MNIFLWILQILLAAVFGMAGALKTMQPKDKLRAQMPWVDNVNAGTVKFLGASELLAAAGLILPAATGIATVLTPLAATGIAIIMVLAAALHGRRKEPQGVGTAVVLLVLAVVVAAGRF